MGPAALRVLFLNEGPIEEGLPSTVGSIHGIVSLQNLTFVDCPYTLLFSDEVT